MKLRNLVLPFLLFLIPASLSALEQEIELVLQKDPLYEVAVTNAAISPSDTTLIEIPADKKLDTVSFSYDNATRELQSTAAETYFVSYIFREYNKCSVTAKITGDLLVEGGSTDDESDKVPFEVVITKEDSSTVTLNSSSMNTVTILEITTASTKLAERKRGSLELILKPVDGKESVIGKTVGKYTSSIIFTVTENGQ